MEFGFRRFFLKALALVVLLGGAPAYGQDALRSELVIEPSIERRDLEVVAIDSEDFELVGYMGTMSIEDFGVTNVQALSLAYQVTSWGFIEAAYGQADASISSYERLSGAARLMTDKQRELSYYSVSMGVNVIPGEGYVLGNTYTTTVYAVGGIGNTTFGGDDRSTVTYGLGYRILLNDWLGLHLNVRGYLFEMELLGEQKTVHNMAFLSGVSLFF